MFIKVSQRGWTLGRWRHWTVEVVIQWFQDRNCLWLQGNLFLLHETTDHSQGSHGNCFSHLVPYRVDLTKIIYISLLKNEEAHKILEIPAWSLEFEYFRMYLLARVLQDLEAMADEFRETGLLNFTVVLGCRTVHDYKLPQDTQVQLCPLYIEQLEKKKKTAHAHVRDGHYGDLLYVE